MGKKRWQSKAQSLVYKSTHTSNFHEVLSFVGFLKGIFKLVLLLPWILESERNKVEKTLGY